jgi:hypothetical protein
MTAASLGSATGSRVDSAAKHTMACKVDGRFLKLTIRNAADDGERVLHSNKNAYSMQKDEIVMNTTKRFHASSSASAYPLVITTLGEKIPELETYLLLVYGSNTGTKFRDNSGKDTRKTALDKIRDLSDKQRFTNVTDALPEFRCQGVALGQAFASPLTGDTVATVLVGGMITVMNGHFEMFAGPSPPTDVLCPFRHARLLTCASGHRRGDDVQWYFDFEKGSFYDDSSSSDRTLQGYRKTAAGEYQPSATNAKRMKHFDHRLMGSEPGIGNSHGMKNSGSIFRIKAYYPLLTKITTKR